MATITIENVPETIVKKFNKTVFSYNEVIFNTSRKRKDPTIKLQKLVNDQKNISYWPFQWAEVDTFLKNLMKK